MARREDGVVAGLVGPLFDSGTAIGRDDADLLDRYVTGRGEVGARAFEAIVARHGGMVLRVCRSTLGNDHDARDAFQATFLVLARRAGSIRQRDRLASWLFGVARKVALRARGDTARRRLRERHAAVAERVDPPRSLDPDNLAALHEEIDRLASTYRDPVILCDLEGLTYEAAARQLDWPLGTLAARLKRARELLRGRLTRRGVAVGEGWLVAARLHSSPLTPGLLRLATPTGTVPSQVASLTIRTITMMRIKTLALATSLLGLTVGSISVGLVAFGGPQVPVSPATPVAPSQPQPRPQPPRSWVRTMPNGLTVELVGVAPYGGAHESWRSPNGQPLAAPPFEAMKLKVYPQDDHQRAWTLALRVGNADLKQISWRSSSQDHVGSSATSLTVDATGEVIPAIQAVIIVLPDNQPTCGGFRFEAASGPWQTIQTSEPAGSGTRGGSTHAIFGKTRSDGEQTTLVVSHDNLRDDVRLVAVDLQGVEHTPVQYMTSLSIATFRQIDAEFSLPLAQIKEFRLQTRPWESVTFEEIPLPKVDNLPGGVGSRLDNPGGS